MLRIAVVGDRDSILGFGALGLEVCCTSDADSCRDVLRRLRKSGEYAVIYITEAAAELVPDEIEKCRDGLIPAIVPIPGTSGNTGLGRSREKLWVEKAVGSDIIFND